MSNWKRTAGAAMTVVAGAGAMTLGLFLRDFSDSGVATSPKTPGVLLASRENLEKSEVEIPEGRYFEQIAELVKEEFVEPVSDEAKLGSGAVRGMVASLGDPRSFFMDPEEFRVFQGEQKGTFEGIGAAIRLEMPAGYDPDAKAQKVAGIPRVIVAAVVPGGPADQAGMKPNDVIDTIDGHWVINVDLLEKFRKLQADVQAGKTDASALRKLRGELRQKSQASLLPTKAKDRLSMGKDGNISLVWNRGGTLMSAKLSKGTSQMNAVTKTGDSYAVRFVEGLGTALDNALPESGTIVLDLRQNDSHDMKLALEALNVLGQKGHIGQITDSRTDTAPEVVNIEGGKRKAKYVLMVDSTTRGAAGVVASALKSQNLAVLQGTPSNDRTLNVVKAVVGGNGYSLVVGSFVGGTK